MNNSIKLLLWITLYLGVGFAIGQATQGNIDTWYQTLDKPSFNPPNWIFPVMWSILYIMLAAAGWKLWQVGAPKSLKIIFIVYTLMNWAWTPIFFGAHELALGFYWLLVINAMNLAFIVLAWRPVRLAAILTIPLICWTLFAMVLSYNIWQLNA